MSKREVLLLSFSGEQLDYVVIEIVFNTEVLLFPDLFTRKSV